jgi:hypothetical protein
VKWLLECKKNEGRENGGVGGRIAFHLKELLVES